MLHKSQILSSISGSLIIFFGIFLTGLIKINFLNKNFKDYQIKFSNNLLFPFIVGIGFGFGWTPCIGPILGSILAYTAMENSLYKGILLLSFYSLGLAVPFVISGIILLITGILIITGKLQIIGFYLIELFPFLQKFG